MTGQGTALELRESHVVKADPYFQLQRVVTSAGDELLIKLATDDRGDEDRSIERAVEREFELLRALGPDHALTALRLDRLGSRLAAVYEAFDGAPLGPPAAAAPLDLAGFSDLAAALCAILAALHGRGGLLLGVCPASFLRSACGRRLVLADAPFAQPPGAAAGTAADRRDRGEALWLDSPYLAYAAPELLGSAAQPVDHRADLYALGGLLYQLLARRPVFDTADPGELRQCHLARQPRPLLELVPSLPPALAGAVMRLLAKRPAERFASVDAFAEAAPIGSSAGVSTAPRRSSAVEIAFSTQLYGHRAAADAVRARLRSVRSAPGIVFFEGEAGIGKTTLLREIQRREPHAHFCVGAFSRSGPAEPLGGWTSAVIDLANVVLTSRTGELELWQTRIQAQLGEWAPLIAELAPEWRAILRCPVPSSHEAFDTSLNRLALAIRRLFACYADEESPVVVVLDDLQWADESSLRMLELILTAPEPLNLLVLATVRAPAAPGDDPDPVRALRDRLRGAPGEVAAIALAPWAAGDALAFVTDSLEGEIADGDALAELLVAKTHGNPFFVRELVRALVQQRAVCACADGTWRWERDAVRRFPATDNVVEFLASRIAGLPDDVKAVLPICACLGREFRIADVCAVHGAPAAVEPALRRAAAHGLVIARDGHRDANRPGASSYEFVHDRVHEAARALVPPDDRAALHLRIARALSRDAAADADEDRTYRVASYFGEARALIDDRAERYACAELELRAGQAARQRGAYSQALGFLRAGLAFLGDGAAAWRDRFALTLALHEATAEVALRNGQIALTYQLCDAILARVDSPLQQVAAYEIRICGLKAEQRFSAAVDAALEILGALGVELPRRPTRARAALGFIATRWRVFAGPLARLVDLPAVRDERVRAAARIIQSVYPAAYIGQPALFPFLVFRHVHHSVVHGNDESSGVTYTAFGVVLAAAGQFDAALELGGIGLELLRRAGADHLRARAVVAYYSFIFPWRHHIRDTLAHYRDGLEAGLAHGDFEYASYMMTLESLTRLHAGDPVSELLPDLERHAAKIRSLGHEHSIAIQNLLCQIAAALREPVDRGSGTADPPASPLIGRFYDERRDLPARLEGRDASVVFHHYLAKLMLCVFLGDPAGAVEAARAGRRHVRGGGFANYLVAVFMTYESLALLSAPRTRGTRGALRRARRNQRVLARLAGGAAMNFAHRHHLVAAELCRARGQGERAAEHFERAIELAQLHGYVHDTGLAQERAAAFYLERGLARLGRDYLRDAHRSYRRWGADAVVRRLEAEHASEFQILAANRDAPSRRAERFADSLDYRMLLKSSQAISGEILLPRLLERLLQNILAHAGAQRAVLVLESRGELRVEAEASVDDDRVQIVGGEPVDDSDRLCRGIVHYAARMTAPVVLGDAARAGLFVADPYVRAHQPRSVLCTPVLHQSKLIGAVYLENNRVSHVFTEACLEVVNLLAAQAAISITNAKLHALELEAQQAKINPHFLFNALSSIADLAVSDGPTAETAIVKLASLYRYILTSSAGELVTLEQEFAIVESYLTLEKLRYGAKLDYEVTADPAAHRVRLPGLLIQPLVENAIRHGVAPKLGPGVVTVHAAVRGDRCCIVVQDDGEGGKASASGTGFGLRSIQERLALAYGQRFSFAISRTGGYRVEIEIPAAV